MTPVKIQSHRGAKQCHTGHLPQGQRGAPADTHTCMWQRVTGSKPEHHPAQDFWSFLNPPWLCLPSCHEASLYPVWAQGGNILFVQFHVFGLAPCSAALMALGSCSLHRAHQILWAELSPHQNLPVMNARADCWAKQLRPSLAF